MLTLKLINEETERVVHGLEKKHFPNAKEAIDTVLSVDKQRREAQQELDKRAETVVRANRPSDERRQEGRG